MIRCKTKRKLYVAPEIEVTTYDEEQLMAGSVGGHGNDQPGSGGFGGEDAKSGRFIIIDDFEDEEYVEDDFNYDNYKNQQMLW